MNKQFYLGFILLSFLLLFGFSFHSRASLFITPEMAQKMGQKIWENECAGQVKGLTTWNIGEDFASLGIGHFIWYPEDVPNVFHQTFPSLMEFFKEHGVQLPAWLAQAKGCPWKSREEFNQAQQSPEMTQLRQLLVDQIPLQVLFLVERLQGALSRMIAKLPEDKQKQMSIQFYRLASTSQGTFALLDYINFKGEGIRGTERYQNQGWGLLQVLEGMSGIDPKTALAEFVASAKSVLARRVQLSSPERNEQRWLQGWNNRVDGYLRVNF